MGMILCHERFAQYEASGRNLARTEALRRETQDDGQKERDTQETNASVPETRKELTHGADEEPAA
jgi:hypothetical protein